MIIDEKELQRRLNSNRNLVNSVLPKPASVPSVSPVSSINKEEKPASNDMRVLGASLIRQGVPEAIVCKEFKLTHKEVRSANEQRVGSNIDKIREIALEKLLIGLGLMTQDKFENADLKVLSQSVTAISRVLERTSEKENNSTTVQFVVHTPESRPVSGYRVIDV